MEQKQQNDFNNTTSRNKDISTDQLIKNILEKVDTDAKITKYYNTHHNQQQKLLNYSNTQQQLQQSWTNNEQQCSSKQIENFYSPLVIPQCFYLHSEIPEIYLKIWQSVQYNDNNDNNEFCDRIRLYEILLKSNLSNDILAKLWSFVNRTKPGELTRNELFVMLALISLVQQNVVNPLQELYSIQTIPVPYFSIFQQQQQCYKEESTLKQDEQNLFDNEFCEFKSANQIDDDNKSTTTEQKQQEDCIQNSIDKIVSEDLFFDIPTNNQEQNINNLEEEEEEDFGDFIQTTNIVDNFENNLFNNNNSEDLFNQCLYFVDENEKKEQQEQQEEQEQEEDKYSFFKNLQNDEFGDFHSQQPIIDQENIVNNNENENKNNKNNDEIKEKILIAIKQVMHKTFNILTVNHDENSVIEALKSNDGHLFAEDLNQIFQIVERIKSTNNNNDKCRMLIEEIYCNWNSIHNLIKKSSITLSTTNDDEIFTNNNNNNNNNENKCFICSISIIDNNKQSIKLNCNNGDKNTTIEYHLSCANFWINFVDTKCLPHTSDIVEIF